jgi:hypothetical protein
VGWHLTRDPAPGRPPEAFLTGAESRYWCLDLKPDDAGLKALFQKVDAAGEEARRKALKGTFLEAFPFPRRRAQLDQIAPLTLEGSLFGEPHAWAARGTFSHQVLRMRAALKLMRWMMTRKTGKATTSEIDGIAVTEVDDSHVAFALVNVGNRVLAANDASRLRAVLGAAAEPPHPAIAALHREIARQRGRLGVHRESGIRARRTRCRDAAVASFDVNPDDELAFRVAVSESAAVPEGLPFKGTRNECGAVVGAFLPMFAAETIEIDGDGAAPPVDGSRVFTGRIRELTKRLPELPKRLGEVLLRSTGSAPQTPSASPIPPSPPSSAGPRSTPAARRRKEAPSLRVDATRREARPIGAKVSAIVAKCDVVAGLRQRAGPPAEPVRMHVPPAQREDVDLGVRELRTARAVLRHEHVPAAVVVKDPPDVAGLEMREVEIALVNQAPDPLARVEQAAGPPLPGATARIDVLAGRRRVRLDPRGGVRLAARARGQSHGRNGDRGEAALHPAQYDSRRRACR